MNFGLDFFATVYFWPIRRIKLNIYVFHLPYISQLHGTDAIFIS